MALITSTSADVEQVLSQLRVYFPGKTNDQIIQVLRGYVLHDDPAEKDGMRWLAERLQRAKGQRETLEEIGKMQGCVWYDWQLDDNVYLPNAKMPGPAWSHNLLREDFYARVVRVGFMGDKVSNSGLRRLECLTALEGLYLDGTAVTDAGLEHLKSMAQLRELGLNFTRISDTGLAYIKGLSRLQDLELVSTLVTDAGLEHLKGLSRLHDLYLNNTRITEAGLKRLQRALPTCNIHWEPVVPTKDEQQSPAAPDHLR
ncbi:MAG: hypothetical protein ACLP9L_33910 [Thermoguttaceae bacterium]